MRQARLKRLTALLLTAAYCLCLFSADAAETENGVQMIEGVFKSPVRGENLHWSFPYSDAFFAAPATEYCHGLAQCTLGMAVSAFRSHDAPLSDKDEFIRAYLSGAGFSGLKSEQYDIEPTEQSIATMLGRKKLESAGEQVTLVAVAVSGGGYHDEWLSNFSFGEDDFHEGFADAAVEVVDRVARYISEEGITGRVKIWMGGYSRAAAVSNLAGFILGDRLICAKDDLYVYAFATPHCTRIAEIDPCPSVFNIVGSFDPVPSVPFAEWGYGRFGTTLYLPAQETSSDYARLRSAVEPLYMQMTGVPYWNNTECNWFLQKICQMLYDMVHTSADYQRDVEEVVKRSWQTKGSLLNRLRSIIGIIASSSGLDERMEKEAGSAKTLFSVFLYDFVMQKLGLMESQWTKEVRFATDLMHEHCPDVYIAWLFSQDDPDALYIDNRGYRRVFLDADLLPALYDSDGLPFDGAAVEKLGEATMLSIPADRDYYLTLTANDDDLALIYLNEYQAGSLKGRTLVYDPPFLENGQSAVIALPSALNAPPGQNALTDASGEKLPPLFDSMTSADESQSVDFDVAMSGWQARHLIEIALAALTLLLTGAAAGAAAAGVKAFRARRARRGGGRGPSAPA